MADAVAEPSKALHWERERIHANQKITGQSLKKKVFSFSRCYSLSSYWSFSIISVQTKPRRFFYFCGDSKYRWEKFFWSLGGKRIGKTLFSPGPVSSRQRLQILAKLYRFLTKNWKILVMARKKLTIFLAGMFRPEKSWFFDPRISRHVPNRIA